MRMFHALAPRNRPRRSRAGTSVRPGLEALESRALLTATAVPTPDHVVIVIEENHAYSQIIGSPAAPYINSLAQQGALFTNSYAIEHPSQPNYLDLFSGSNQGITSDATPQTITAPNLAGELEAAGQTFGGYAEDLPYVGFTGNASGAYGRNHNPWVNFTDVPAGDNMPFAGYFPSDFSTLPAVSIVVPNKSDSMHDGVDPARIQAGDAWLSDNIGPYVQWAQTNNSLLIVTWDEDDHSEGNRVATLFVGPMVVPGQYNEPITHYNVLRTVEDMYGLPYAGSSADVDPITDTWTTSTQTATHFSITTSSNTTAGTPVSVTVTALDGQNNPVPNYAGTVHFTSSDGQATLPGDYTFTPDEGGTHTFSGGATLVTAGSQTITVGDTADGTIGGEAGVDVSWAAADHLGVVAPGDVTAGAPFDLTVTVQDAYNNTVADYTGTVTFSSTDPDPGVVLPADYTFSPTAGGTATFSGGATLITPGDQTISVIDPANGLITGGVLIPVAGADSGDSGTWGGYPSVSRPRSSSRRL